jgi:hypothetical protein
VFGIKARKPKENHLYKSKLSERKMQLAKVVSLWWESRLSSGVFLDLLLVTNVTNTCHDCSTWRAKKENTSPGPWQPK